MMMKDNKQEKVKITKDKVSKEDRYMINEKDVEATPKKDLASKKELIAKRVTPISKKKDEFY